MAHPVSDDWPIPSRYARLQYAIAVCVLGVAVALSMLAILVVGAVVGAVLGVDMSPLR
jgi:hypothetical protein